MPLPAKLSVERLPVCLDAAAAEATILRANYGHILRDL
jgi:hypothetical protein